MIGIVGAGMSDAAAWGAPAFDLGRGAIAGAFIVAAAFLAGYAAIRRSGIAVCALLMVAGAAALEFSWLGFFSAMPSEIAVLIMGLFAAAAIIFLLATIGAAKYNPLLGGLMFTAALVIAGMGVINFFDRIELAPIMRLAVLGVGAFAVLLAVSQAVRGDIGARLILPGIALAMAAPLLGPLGGIETGAFALAPHGLFTLGVIAASLVALTESAPPRVAEFAGESFHGFSASDDASPAIAPPKNERMEIVLDSSLARVLDYSGVAIWDWSPDLIDQTETLPSLLGADSTAPFTPDALCNFIAKDDLQRFKDEVLTPIDGPFDVALNLFDGRKIRLRGARAAREETGTLERIVAFIETASPIFKPSKNNGVDGKTLQNATKAAIIPAAGGSLADKLGEALDKGDIVAAFQPIVALKDKKTVGYEALARWRDQKDGAHEGPETFVRAADAAGKGAMLAKIMLEEAATFLADKIKTGKGAPPFVAMNVSWLQMRNPDFVGLVGETIKKYKLPKDALVIELTEGDAVEGEAAADIFSAYKKAGAALAFDDFGAGFSCLTNLRKYDFDYLKIDKSFTDDLSGGGDGVKIINSLAALGKDLGLKVIVEGVESDKAVAAATKLGLELAQGYALGKPVETARKTAKLADDKRAVVKAGDVKIGDAKMAATQADKKSAPTKDDKKLKAAADDYMKADKTDKSAEQKETVLAKMADETAALEEKKTARWMPWRRGELR
ncbi:diguanylate cyclase/phosphodiesterase (GGDEF & EAL domains) with PAS/PAC sensor(s) [hydrothermal vent metagenome]|uniref:Diguanylate cyclase/phosphodiesterase (GGDEF & EAL domains) with PAS/PAC sensor(S) n=1 Tax=hydrothermal vent metagenome TaxID=652676 RepID=A0A3B0S3P9_9ZZZZ